ncbi:MAG: TIGR03663 family protein [Opitutus sp.]|nr:TIGR03663 family protein [Opitutus sp.]
MPFLRWLPLALITLAAFWLRSHDLARRPMHADEANQAVKLGELLDTGHYAFDPRDHHGPTLYFAAVPVAWVRADRSLATLTETTVRLVPALFGTATIILIALLAAPLGRWPALTAAAFVAVSPPAVYYSRYFIQETLLATFFLAGLLCARTWWRTGLTRWAIATGVFVGLMQATKASTPLFVAAAVAALFFSRSCERKRADPAATSNNSPRSRSPLRAATAALFVALFTAALLYSSFGTHLAGVRDALGAYTHAIARFGAEADPTGHEKPWWYYLKLFGWYREGGLVWHQVAFSALAIIGVVVAFVTKRVSSEVERDLSRSKAVDEPTAPGSRLPPAFLRGVAIYTLLITSAFSLFAYKTPWHAVHLVPGFAVFAAASLAAVACLRTGRLLAVALALIVTATLFQQTWRTSFLRPADQRNPYAYVHSSADVLKYRALAEAAIVRSPGQPIRVISEENYWPLPWYLRGLPRVGYWATAPDDCNGALVIATTTQADAVRARLRGKYHESFLGLRPGVVCIVFTPEP